MAGRVTSKPISDYNISQTRDYIKTVEQPSSTGGSMPIATIIGAVIAAGAAIIGTAVNNQQVDEYNAMGERLANLKRQDELKLQEENARMNRMGMRQRKKEFKWTQGEADKDRKERKGEREYGKRQQGYANTMGMVNSNAQLRSVFMNTMTRGRK